ncbi:hypothetical protein [Humibacillus xanthopallidus]|nr:hypothetical protein [Humibacillus xanthopallidus]
MHHGSDTTGVHGMLLFGDGPFYLSHLPMFSPPHNYQAILQVTLEDDAAGQIRNIHAHFGRDRLLTVRPETFAITDLSPMDSSQPRTEFRGDVVHGHFEHGGDVVAANTLIRVDEVVTFRELSVGPSGSRTSAGERDELAYLPVGDADEELFLAHVITAAPDFDQVLRVSVSGGHFTRTELERQGRPTITIGRPDLPANRLDAEETVAGRSSAGQHFHTEVEVEVLSEVYFMEDELR